MWFWGLTVGTYILWMLRNGNFITQGWGIILVVFFLWKKLIVTNSKIPLTPRIQIKKILRLKTYIL